MPASKAEQVLDALNALLETASDAVVERNSVLPEKVPDGGLIILRDGDPGEPEQALGGFRTGEPGAAALRSRVGIGNRPRGSCVVCIAWGSQRTGGSRMVRLVLVLGLLFSATAAAQTARIATWNLGGFFAIPADKLDRIIDGLRRLDADLVILPELNPISHAETIAARLSETPGACFRAAAPDQPRAPQEIGFVFKCSVTVTNAGLLAGSDLGRRGYRNAAIAAVRIGAFDFVVVGLHLKAGRGLDDRIRRSEQAAFISGFVQGVLRSGENDVLIIGDYNMIPGDDDENFEIMNADGSLRFVSSEALADSFTHISSGTPGNLLDGYAFTNVDPAEYREGSVAIVAMHERLGLSLAQYAGQVTDHLPVLAEFDVSVDHD